MDARGLQSTPKPIGVMATIAEQPLCLWQVVQQRGRTSIVADLPGGYEGAGRSPVRIGDCVQLGIHGAFCTANQAPEIAFFARRLGAVRCTVR